MSFDYTRTAATATRIIDRFGQRSVLRKAGAKSGPSHDRTAGTPVDFVVKVVDLNPMVTDRAGTMTETSRRTLIISTEGLPVLSDGSMISPQNGDHVLIGEGESTAVVDGEAFVGREHVLGEVRPLAPGGVVVLWETDLVG